jgi:beta-N-acetylhexosaminidase
VTVTVGAPDADLDTIASDAVRRAAGRSLIAVVRDAHRDVRAQALVRALIARRPDTIVLEMGLPLWRPLTGAHGAYGSHGTDGSHDGNETQGGGAQGAYIATYGAARTNGQAAAEILGLIPPRP